LLQSLSLVFSTRFHRGFPVSIRRVKVLKFDLLGANRRKRSGKFPAGTLEGPVGLQHSPCCGSPVERPGRDRIRSALTAGALHFGASIKGRVRALLPKTRWGGPPATCEGRYYFRSTEATAGDSAPEGSAGWVRMNVWENAWGALASAAVGPHLAEDLPPGPSALFQFGAGPVRENRLKYHHQPDRFRDFATKYTKVSDKTRGWLHPPPPPPPPPPHPPPPPPPPFRAIEFGNELPFLANPTLDLRQRFAGLLSPTILSFNKNLRTKKNLPSTRSICSVQRWKSRENRTLKPHGAPQSGTPWSCYTRHPPKLK